MEVCFMKSNRYCIKNSGETFTSRPRSWISGVLYSASDTGEELIFCQFIWSHVLLKITPAAIQSNLFGADIVDYLTRARETSRGPFKWLKGPKWKIYEGCERSIDMVWRPPANLPSLNSLIDFKVISCLHPDQNLSPYGSSFERQFRRSNLSLEFLAHQNMNLGEFQSIKFYDFLWHDSGNGAVVFQRFLKAHASIFWLLYAYASLIEM